MIDVASKEYTCKLCGIVHAEKEMSEEHYPARSTGNEDVVAFNIVEMIDILQSGEMQAEILKGKASGKTLEEIAGHIFDTRLSVPLYPRGRTAKTLCKKCNTFLGKYDEAYLKFFNVSGDPKSVKGFQQHTKYQIIKAIYAKFLSIPETDNEKFDFLDFIRDKKSTAYDGEWNIYFVKRDFSSDLFGMQDIGTGKAIYDEGVVYEMSDEKFIFNLMNFQKHSCFDMTNLFDILNKSYTLIEGVGKEGGYHAQILMSRLFSENEFLWNY